MFEEKLSIYETYGGSMEAGLKGGIQVPKHDPAPLAARHADSIIAGAQGNKAKKEFRDDVRRRAAKFGRNPDDIKVLFLFSAVMGETEEEAQAKFKRYAAEESFLHAKLALVSGFSDIDLSKYPWDKPLPVDLTTNGETASFNRFAQLGSRKPLSQLVQDDVVDIVGTPEQVADHMAQVMEEVGGDGFLIRDQMQHINRCTILEVTEGLVPALQRRGLVRTEYTKPTLRETLKEF